MPTPVGFPLQRSALPFVLVVASLFFVQVSDACRPSSGAAVGFLFTNLGGANWKTATGWSSPLTKAVAKNEFFGLKQSTYVSQASGLPTFQGADVIFNGVNQYVQVTPLSSTVNLDTMETQGATINLEFTPRQSLGVGQREMLYDVATPDGNNGFRMYREQDFIKFEIIRNGAGQSGSARLQYRTQFRSNTGTLVTQPQEPYNELLIVTVIISVVSNTQQMFVNGLPVPIDANGNLGTLAFNAAQGQFAYPRSARYAMFVGKQADTSRPGYALSGGEIFTYSGSLSYFGVFDTWIDTSGENSELKRMVSGSCCSVARHGITCTGLDVTDINLASNGIVGTLPSTFFTYFKLLKSFDISSQCSQAAQCQNTVASVFSSDMYLPPTLSTLVLNNNNIQGSLPADVIRGASPALTTLEVTGNSLSGKMLPFENNCPFVRYSLRFNSFYGSIDNTIGRCKMLVYLDLSFNMLNGTVPDAIRSPLAQSDSSGGGFLQYVDLSMNMFRGTLPKFGSVVSARPASLNLDDVSVCRKDENIAFHILGYLAPPTDPLRLRLVLRPQCSGSKSTYMSDKMGDL